MSYFWDRSRELRISLFHPLEPRLTQSYPSIPWQRTRPVVTKLQYSMSETEDLLSSIHRQRTRLIITKLQCCILKTEDLLSHRCDETSMLYVKDWGFSLIYPLPAYAPHHYETSMLYIKDWGFSLLEIFQRLRYGQLLTRRFHQGL